MDNDTHISVPNGVGDQPGMDLDHDGPMTPSQASQLKSLAAEAGVPADVNLNRRDAAKKIDELQGKMTRGAAGDA